MKRLILVTALMMLPAPVFALPAEDCAAIGKVAGAAMLHRQIGGERYQLYEEVAGQPESVRKTAALFIEEAYGFSVEETVEKKAEVIRLFTATSLEWCASLD